MAINDATWEPVSRLRDLTLSEEVECGCWSLTLLDDGGQSLEVPGDFNPLEHQGELPTQTLDSLLLALKAGGWSVKLVATRCYSPDDLDRYGEPDDNLIREVRYELGRLDSVFKT